MTEQEQILFSALKDIQDNTSVTSIAYKIATKAILDFLKSARPAKPQPQKSLEPVSSDFDNQILNDKYDRHDL